MSLTLEELIEKVQRGVLLDSLDATDVNALCAFALGQADAIKRLAAENADFKVRQELLFERLEVLTTQSNLVQYSEESSP